MSTYFHGNSEIPGGGGDGLQTLILMNPAYAGYSDNQSTTTAATPHNNNFVFLNSNSPANNGHNLHHAPPQQFVGIPLHGASAVSPRESHHHHQQQDVSALHGFLPQQQRLHYNFYNMPIDLAAARDVPRAQQGLSLSLSSQQQQPQLGYGSFRQEREVPSHQQSMVAGVSPSRVGGGDEVRGSPSSASGVSNGVTGVQSVLMSSKYLKAAQELLDEVVNVGKGSNKISGGAESSKGANEQTKNAGDSSPAAATNGDGGSCKRVADLTTPERQEIQMKKAKLVNMLDEVEQRYRQYHHQMQIVITWFEQAAGIGSAKTYTALALQTISKQFRCLKDAILSQIRSASRSLGEEDYIQGKLEGSRLKYVDNQIRQQRALQQLGMIQQNAWRPQRGLPERSVSVLRAWLFEHFLHPYPKDSDKLMLAKQTGLTRSQVSNWFINARVRLWKPMVEEMYMEEMKEHEKNGGSEDQHKDDDEDSPSKSTSRQPNSNSPGGVPDNRRQNHTSKFHDSNPMMIQNPPTMSISPTSTSPRGLPIIRNVTGFNLIGSSSDIAAMRQQSPKKLRSDILRSSMDLKSEDNDNNNNIQLKFAGERQGRDGGFTLMGAPTNFIGAFGSYPIPELSRFGAEQFPAGPYSGNGVSLTLGLPHCESISMQGAAHQSFIQNQQTMQLGRGVEIGETNNFAGMNTQNSGNVYENINIQNRKRYAAQLLPDFVA